MPEQQFILKSADRDTTAGWTSSSFKITFSGDVWKSEAWRNVVQINLIGAIFQNTLYNVRSGVNNTIQWNNASTGSNKSATLTVGSYTIDTLIVEIQTQMNAVDADSYVVTYSATSNKVTISAAHNVTIKSTGTVNSLIGYSTTANSDTGAPVAPNVFNLTQPYNLYINIPDLELFHVKTSNSLDKPTFTIPVTTPEGNEIAHWASQTFDQVIRYGNPRSFKDLTVNLTLDGNEAANLNGSEWTLYLLLKTL
jgi:hypothetical protein